MWVKHFLAKKSSKMKSFIKGIFEKESQISSKRITGFLMITWGLSCATYFCVKTLQSETPISHSQVVDLIEYSLMTGALLLGGGTVAESFQFSKNKQSENTDYNEKS
jgi:hypothetical protein